MLPLLSDDQRQAIEEDGTPLPVIDKLAGSTYILLSVQFIPDPLQGGFTAHIPGVAAYGGGETKQEASLALCEALRSYMDAFGREPPV